MCPSLRILNRTKNGVLTFCNSNKLFQLVFNNLCFEFYEWELNAFKDYIAELDAAYWEKVIPSSPTQRKIPISVGNKCFIILVNAQEILEIKRLLDIQNNSTGLISANDIDYTYFEN